MRVRGGGIPGVAPGIGAEGFEEDGMMGYRPGLPTTPPRPQCAHPALHHIAILEREIWGEVLSESVVDHLAHCWRPQRTPAPTLPDPGRTERR